jgi:hypothetical protein
MVVGENGEEGMNEEENEEEEGEEDEVMEEEEEEEDDDAIRVIEVGYLSYLHSIEL